MNKEFTEWLDSQIKIFSNGMNSKDKNLREKSFISFSAYTSVRAKLEEVENPKHRRSK